MGGHKFTGKGWTDLKAQVKMFFNFLTTQVYENAALWR